MAIGVLRIFDESTLNEVNATILLRQIPFANKLNNMQLAYKCKCKRFLADNCVKAVTESLWKNEKIKDSIAEKDKVLFN